MSERIAVIGLGYVGLPLALAFARDFPDTVGFDINTARIAALRAGHDKTGVCTDEELAETTIRWSADLDDLRGCTFFVVAVPTPVDATKRPDLRLVCRAAETVGSVIQPGGVAVFESTVYPGVTEETCGPIITRVSGLRQGVDYHLGYSPERINPGDTVHTLPNIVKVVSGDDDATLERVAAVYGRVVPAGIFRAASIKVAEAAKVIENTQRDLNIALMNELAQIFDMMGIATRDVLAAANTKWNFLRFFPGLVGGHCIGVDPYYLTAKAEELGYHPQVILAGRRVNDGMGGFVATKLVKLLIERDLPVKNARIGILGLTFKEDVPDLRNSRVPDIINELTQYGITPLVHDPLADLDEAVEEYGLSLSSLSEFRDLDGLILAVPHQAYRDLSATALCGMLRADGVLIDVKSMLTSADITDDYVYWSL
jgi:UDP-N-acetyl-D-galactosamine dehydrogenase